MGLLKYIETDNFFCCFSLKTGSTVIGIYHVLLGFFFTVENFYVAVHHFHYNLESGLVPEKQQLVYSMETVSTIQFFFGAYLLWGAIKANRTYVLSGLILDSMSLVMSLTGIAFAVSAWVALGTRPPHQEFVLEKVASMFLNAYFMVIVYNYYRQLQTVNSTNSEDLVRSRGLGVEVGSF